MPLDAAELAFMRETQAEHRPTAAELSRRISTRSPTGGQVDGWAEAEPVQVRLAAVPDRVPSALADKYGMEALVQVSLDLTHDVRSGDRLTVSPTEAYQIVTDGEPTAWTTAQTCWANRTVRPRRGS